MADSLANVYRGALSSIDEVVEEARSGRMFILVADVDRENEGDLCIPPQKVPPEVINFLVTPAPGLICLSITRHLRESLGLPLMSWHHGHRHEPASTVSNEPRQTVPTSISTHHTA